MVATLQAGDTKANCANDWLTFMASLSEVAVAGAAVFWTSLLGHVENELYLFIFLKKFGSN